MIKSWVVGCLIAGILCTFNMAYASEELALPRFVSLRNDQVNLRTGPGDRYPISWVYMEKSYPVEVVDEFELWRQIREVDGTTGWVHRTQINSARNAVILEEDRLTAKPSMESGTVAIVQKGTIGKIEKCPRASDFCLLSFGETKGWIRKKVFFGVYPNEVID